MGGPKALLDMGGATLLELQLRALRGAQRVAVVYAEGSDPVSLLTTRAPSVAPVPNSRVDEGPFVSIRLGLEAMGGEAPVLIVPVDCPVPPGAPELLVRAAGPGLAWVAPTRDGHRGHPVLLTAAGRAAALDAAADRTLRDLLNTTPGAEVPMDSPLVHCNLNTPAELESFLSEHPSWPQPSGGTTP